MPTHEASPSIDKLYRSKLVIVTRSGRVYENTGDNRAKVSEKSQEGLQEKS